MISIYHQSNGKKAAKCARESGWRSPFALLLVHYRLFKSLSVKVSGAQAAKILSGLLKRKVPAPSDPDADLTRGEAAQLVYQYL